MTVDNNASLQEEILRLKKEKHAVIMAHYYVPAEVQEVADHIGDSLALAQIAARVEEPVIVLCGVGFMGETAKILCPEKKVLIPDASAGCSLADSCPADEFRRFVEAHPDHTVVSYVNTSAEVKALSDVLVTSSNALKIVDSFPKGEKIIFGPDRNLGSYIASMTGRDLLLWDGACHVHDRFSLEGILALKREHPEAKVLVHPECPRPIVLVADKVGSTAALLSYAEQSDAREFIVATEPGILYEMRRRCPGKAFIPAPPEASEGTVGCSCNDCSYMKLNTLRRLRDCLLTESPEVEVDPEVAAAARRPIERMLDLSK